MSYPRNAASPPHFLVGYVYDSTTNALQTSGVSARVKTGTGAWGNAAGTLECDTTSGAWTYTPTQAETNADAFSVSLLKTGCSGVGITVITGRSANAGYVAPDWGQVLNASSTNNLSGTTIKAVTDSVAATVSDKTGYKLASDGLAAISAWSVTITGNLVGNVTGSVNSVTSVVSANVTQWNGGSLPTIGTSTLTAQQVWEYSGARTLSAFGFTVAANVTQWNGGSLPTIGTSTLTAQQVWEYSTRTLSAFSFTVAANVTQWAGGSLPTIPTASENADAVWDEVMSGHTTAGTYGGRIPRSDSSNVNVKITGSSHIAADVHELQPAVIEAQHFAAGAIDSSALAASAVQEIADTILSRALTTAEATAGTISLCTMILVLTGKASVTGGVLTVYRTNGSTVHATIPVASDPNAEPIVGIG